MKEDKILVTVVNHDKDVLCMAFKDSIDTPFQKPEAVVLCPNLRAAAVHAANLPAFKTALQSMIQWAEWCCSRYTFARMLYEKNHELPEKYGLPSAGQVFQNVCKDARVSVIHDTGSIEQEAVRYAQAIGAHTRPVSESQRIAAIETLKLIELPKARMNIQITWDKAKAMLAKQPKLETIERFESRNALEWSQQILAIAKEMSVPVSNLRLQKILYLFYGYTARMCHTEPFFEPIKAWAYGPCIESSYYQYCVWAAEPILPLENIEIDVPATARKIIEAILKKINAVGIQTIVDECCTHPPVKDTPLKKTIDRAAIITFFTACDPLSIDRDILNG